MGPTTPSAMARTRSILEDLEAVRENLLALSDDIWLSIDHNDPQALDAGVEFKRAYNAKAAAFDQVASDLSALVQQYTSVRLEEAEETGADNREQNARIIAELNRDQPHTLDEDFTYKRPHGFILDGQATTGVTTWQRVYELVCQQLYARDAGEFRGLRDHPEFVSNRGHHTVTHDAGTLRKPLGVGGGLFIEANLSANGIRDVVVRLLNATRSPSSECRCSCVKTEMPPGSVMLPEQPAPTVEGMRDSPMRKAVRPKLEVWVTEPGDSDYPSRLKAAAHPWSSIYGVGNRSILSEPALGLICSIKCPGNVVIKTFDAIRELRDAGIVVAGGFHSPMERDCLDFLLRGDQPIIVCPARYPSGARLHSTWRAAIDAGHLLLLAPFSKDVRRTTKANAQIRNEFVAALSLAVLVPHATNGGKAEAAAQQAITRGTAVFTFEDETNDRLPVSGAASYQAGRIQRYLAAISP